MWVKMATWKLLLKTTFVVVPVTITFTDVVASFSKVIGVSMQPLLNPDCNRGQNDWVLQNRLAANQTLQRGDIITFMSGMRHLDIKKYKKIQLAKFEIQFVLHWRTRSLVES
ncbi:mitochondrial inner membrane protease subunit 2-like, partial [Ruditapes philippinarum]|uniref:mitochondrial inner membrane protease subunit 2-like n=1 Tax=Ruditapes philippinarum TaxID=129788 RepID=UPI00295AE7AC